METAKTITIGLLVLVSEWLSGSDVRLVVVSGQSEMAPAGGGPGQTVTLC